MFILENTVPVTLLYGLVTNVEFSGEFCNPIVGILMFCVL